jgi:hypothetical protein
MEAEEPWVPLGEALECSEELRQVIESEQGLQWQVRTHKRELVAANLLIKPGKSWLVKPTGMARFMIEVGRRRAAAAVGEAT